jgi:hypothetical protein
MGYYGPGGPDAAQHGPGMGQYGPGTQPYGPREGGSPYPGDGYRYGRGPRQHGPNGGQWGPGAPDPGHGHAGWAGQGPTGPTGPTGPGRSGRGRPEQYGPGYYDEGPHRPGQWGPGGPGPGRAGQGPGQGQPRPGSGSGRLGEPPRDGGGRPDLRNTGGWVNAGGPLITQRDRALPDPPPNAKGAIAAIEADNIGAFARDLRVLRSQADLDYPDMAEKSHYTMRTLASAAGGLRLPTLPVLIAYVKACGGDVTDWEERWGKLIKAGKKGHAALPAAGSDTSQGDPGDRPGPPDAHGAGPAPQGPPRSGEVYVITSAKPRDDH